MGVDHIQTPPATKCCSFQRLYNGAYGGELEITPVHILVKISVTLDQGYLSPFTPSGSPATTTVRASAFNRLRATRLASSKLTASI